MSVQELKAKADELREQIKDAEQRKAMAEGKLETLMAQLKKDFGVKSIDEAEKKLAKLDEEKKSLEEEHEVVEKEINELLEKHNVQLSGDAE